MTLEAKKILTNRSTRCLTSKVPSTILKESGVSKIEDDQSVVAVLVEEIELIRSEIPLDTSCSHGGWPDDDSIQVEIDSVQHNGVEILVEMTVRFSEIVPTGCSAPFRIVMTRRRIDDGL